jgi:hypothetical protein
MLSVDSYNRKVAVIPGRLTQFTFQTEQNVVTEFLVRFIASIKLLWISQNISFHFTP